MANGDGGEFAHYLRGPGRPVAANHPVQRPVKNGEFGRDDALYLLSARDAPRGKILRLPLDMPDLATAKVVVPESDAVIEDFAPSADGLYVQDLVGGPSQIRFFDS